MERFYIDNLPSIENPRNDGSPVFAIPSDDVLEDVLKFFGLSQDRLATAFTAYKWPLAKLWSEFKYDAFDRLAITADREFKASEIVFPKGPERRSYVTINGFISNDILTELIRRYEPVEEIPKEWDLGTKRGVYLHPSVIQAVYDELGVSGFEELFPTPADYKQFFEELSKACKPLLDPTVYMMIPRDSEEVYVLDRWFSVGPGVVFISSIPAIIARKLKSRLENRKNPVGIAVPRKDLVPVVAQNLKGKDLVAMCNANQELRRVCDANDFAIYKQHLWNEFGLNFNEDSHGYPDARTLYIQMHTLYAEARLGSKLDQRPVHDPGRPIMVWNGRARSSTDREKYETIIPPYVEGVSPVGQFYVLTTPGNSSNAVVILLDLDRKAERIIESPGASFFDREDGLEMATQLLRTGHLPRTREGDIRPNVYVIQK